jgi:hypothetical protein
MWRAGVDLMELKPNVARAIGANGADCSSDACFRVDVGIVLVPQSVTSRSLRG